MDPVRSPRAASVPIPPIGPFFVPCKDPRTVRPTLNIAASILALLGPTAPADPPLLCAVASADTAIARPALSGSVSYVVSKNFRVHYTVAGTDSSSDGLAALVSGAAEESRAVYEGLGWLAPPPDSGLGGPDPDTLYDIYILDLNVARKSTASGLCHPGAPHPVPYPEGSTSWIEIDRAFDFPVPAGIIPPDTLFRAVVAHEVHHAVQNRYRRSPGRDTTFPHLYDSLWFYEQTAVRMEDVVYDDINTLSRIILPLSITNPLVHTRYPVDFPDHLYTGATWPTFLDEYYGEGTVRRAWEAIGEIPGPHYLSKIDSALRRWHSSGLGEAVREYAVWRYFTGDPDSGGRADAYHFGEGASWPASEVLAVHTGDDASGSQGNLYPLGPGGMQIVVFDSVPSALRISFNGGDAYRWAASVIGHRDGAESFEAPLGLDSSRIGVARVPTAGTDRLVLVAVNADTFLTVNPSFSYAATAVPDANVPAAMSAGWNLVSVPGVVPDFSVDSLYPTALSKAWTGTPYESRDTLSNGPGFWVKYPPFTVKTYAGAPFDILWVPVAAGWNIVGSIGTALDVGRIVPSRGTERLSPFWGFGGAYHAAGAITPGKGYWVKMSGAGYLTYNATLPAGAVIPAAGRSADDR